MAADVLKRNYTSVDVFKFFAAILIVAIHTDPFGLDNQSLLYAINYAVYRNAVPFFFVASAFFLFSKPFIWDNAKRYCKRIFILTLAWFILQTPYIIYGRIIDEPGDLESKVNAFYRLLLWESGVPGGWFLFGCIQSVLLMYFLSVKCKLKDWMLVIIGILMYTVSAFSTVYKYTLENDHIISQIVGYVKIFTNDPTHNVFSSFIYFAIGKLIVKHGNLSAKKCLTAVLVLSIAEFLEIYTIWNIKPFGQNNVCFFTLLPMSYFLFQLCLKIKIDISGEKSLYIRKCSIIYYLMQFIIISILTKLFNIENGLILFLLTLLCVSCASYFIIKESDKYPILKKLY